MWVALVDPCEECRLALGVAAVYAPLLLISALAIGCRLTSRASRLLRCLDPEGQLLQQVHPPLAATCCFFLALRIVSEGLVCSSSTAAVYIRVCFQAAAQGVLYILQLRAVFLGLNACAFKSIRFKRRLMIATRVVEVLWCIVVAAWTTCMLISVSSPEVQTVEAIRDVGALSLVTISFVVVCLMCVLLASVTRLHRKAKVPLGGRFKAIAAAVLACILASTFRASVLVRHVAERQAGGEPCLSASRRVWGALAILLPEVVPLVCLGALALYARRARASRLLFQRSSLTLSSKRAASEHTPRTACSSLFSRLAAAILPHRRRVASLLPPISDVSSDPHVPADPRAPREAAESRRSLVPRRLRTLSDSADPPATPTPHRASLSIHTPAATPATPRRSSLSGWLAFGSFSRRSLADMAAWPRAADDASLGEGSGGRARRVSEAWRRASPFARREAFTAVNERDLQSKKAHLLLGRSARSRVRYDTAGGGRRQQVEELLNESYFFWQLPAVYLPLVLASVRDHTLAVQRDAFGAEAMSETALVECSEQRQDSEVANTDDASIISELLFDCISVLSQTPAQLRAALHRSYLSYLESLQEPLALHADPSGARLSALGLAGLSFKPSSKKSSNVLRFAATNCQVQQMVVAGPARKVPTPAEHLAIVRHVPGDSTHLHYDNEMRPHTALCTSHADSSRRTATPPHSPLKDPLSLAPPNEHAILLNSHAYSTATHFAGSKRRTFFTSGRQNTLKEVSDSTSCGSSISSRSRECGEQPSMRRWTSKGSEGTSRPPAAARNPSGNRLSSNPTEVAMPPLIVEPSHTACTSSPTTRVEDITAGSDDLEAASDTGGGAISQRKLWKRTCQSVVLTQRLTRAVYKYDTVTVGAPAAHALGLKESVVSLEHKLAKMDESIDIAWAEVATERSHAEALRKEEMLGALLLRRQWLELRRHKRLTVCVSQALTAIVSALYQQLQTSVAKAPEELLHWSECGCLVGWESLLSTHGKENKMLGDCWGAVRRLSHSLQLALAPVQGLRKPRVDVEWLHAARATHRQASSASSAARARAKEAVEGAMPCVGRCGAGPRGAGGMPDAPFDGDLLVTLFVPHSEFEQMPLALRNKSRSLTVHICLFSQGVNEQQTIANAKGTTALQEAINLQSIQWLEEYSRSYAAFRLGESHGAACDTSVRSTAEDSVRAALRRGNLPDEVSADEVAALSKAEREVLEVLRVVADARAVIEEGAEAHQKRKDTRILSFTAHVMRAMQAARIVSCKSAKDRTSMSVTSEQVDILRRWHQLPEEAAETVLDSMRRNGVRMHNTFQNVGKAGYAFNRLQRMLLPKSLRATADTTAKVQS
ncbi:hypothetical protein AB1Y20_017583 [Prymnesium parvum]|uniref:Uncharacterized protein n=1 Tax=Prymnesium parvum TaxID=97485 RepID=A0AB34JKM6_PRYPA